MGTNNSKITDSGTNIKTLPIESSAVWEQLLRLAEGGDIRAIKLYYDMLEKKQHAESGGASPDIEPMAAIRRAVFGDAAVDAAAGKALGGTSAMSVMGGQTLPDTEVDDDW